MLLIVYIRNFYKGYQYPISLEAIRQASHIPFSKLGNIIIINFPKYPNSLKVNKNIPEITNTKIQAQEQFRQAHVIVCALVVANIRSSLFYIFYVQNLIT